MLQLTLAEALRTKGRKGIMSRRFDPEYDGPALTKCEAIGMKLDPFPMGDNHHTDAPLSDDDRRVGEALSYFLGGLFIDKQEGVDPSTPVRDTYWHNEMTSRDIWTRVARALRIHGLKITTAERG